MDSERVKTHVDGLDELVGGGIPKGHVVLISGLPGTMKSSLTYAILHRNAQESLPGPAWPLVSSIAVVPRWAFPRAP